MHGQPRSDSAEPRDLSVSMGRANAWALMVVLPPVALFAALFVVAHGWGPIAAAGRLPLALLLGALIAGILAHELLHVLAWRLASRLPWADVRLGFQLRTLTPYAHARVPMSARAYRIGAATPGLVLGVVPALAAIAVGDGALLLFGLLFTIAAGGDALILWILRGVAPGQLVLDHPTRAGCFVWDAGIAPAAPSGREATG